MKDDLTLINDSLAGDTGAFAVLLERYLGMIYKFSYYYVRDAAEAEDIAQETFIRAWKHLKKFDQEKNFKTWLFAIAKNAALDFLKKKKPIFFSRMAENDDELASILALSAEAGDSPDAMIDRKMLKADLEEALRKLPSAYQTVLSLRYNDNLKFIEIAEKLGEPIDTVKSRHRRGIIILRGIIDVQASYFSDLRPANQ
jgi:RNA polymerase sigma-70 factor (ECF subfamily)